MLNEGKYPIYSQVDSEIYDYLNPVGGYHWYEKLTMRIVVVALMLLPTEMSC